MLNVRQQFLNPCRHGGGPARNVFFFLLYIYIFIHVHVHVHIYIYIYIYIYTPRAFRPSRRVSDRRERFFALFNCYTFVLVLFALFTSFLLYVVFFWLHSFFQLMLFHLFVLILSFLTSNKCIQMHIRMHQQKKLDTRQIDAE